MSEEKNNNPQSVELSPVEKGAIILALTDPDIAAEVVSELTPNELRNLILAFDKLRTVSKEVIDAVIQEFIQSYETLLHTPSLDPEEFIKRIIDKVPPNIREVLENLLNQPAIKIKLQQLEMLPPKQLANLLKKEHPQIIAVILSLLSPSTAAKVLKHFPEPLKLEVVKRMALLESIPAQQIQEIAENFLQEIKEFVGEEIRIDGTKQAANLLTSLDRSTAEEIIEKLEEEDPDLADKIREKMFTFEDLAKLSDKDIVEILKAVDKHTLTLALKDAPKEIVDKFLRNMSKRAAQILLDDMEALGKVRMSDIIRARRQLVNIVKRLVEQGLISLHEEEEEEI
jgi:flagellar motor switch protein FliG